MTAEHSNEGALQYLTWALEEIEKLGQPEAAAHVRKALEQLGNGPARRTASEPGANRHTREAKRLRDKADEADQLALHARTSARRDALAKIADTYRRTAEQLEDDPAGVSRLTIPDDDRFGFVTTGAIKTSPLVLQIDRLDERDGHGHAAARARIAGGGGPARLRLFGIRHAASFFPAPFRTGRQSRKDAKPELQFELPHGSTPIPLANLASLLSAGARGLMLPLGLTGEALMRDPSTVAAVVSVLRQAHGDDLARMMLNEGLSLAVLIDASLRSSMKNRDAVRLITGALSSGDFNVTPDLGSMWHLKYFYDPPKSLYVVDVAVVTLDRGTIDSPDVHLRLRSQP